MVDGDPAPTVLAAQGQALGDQVLAHVLTNVPARTGRSRSRSTGATAPRRPRARSSRRSRRARAATAATRSSPASSRTWTTSSIRSARPSRTRLRRPRRPHLRGGRLLPAKVTVDDGLGTRPRPTRRSRSRPSTLAAQSPTSIDAIAGTAVGGPLARVVDLAAGATTDPAQLTATIDWGDGSTPTAGEVHGRRRLPRDADRSSDLLHLRQPYLRLGGRRDGHDHRHRQVGTVGQLDAGRPRQGRDADPCPVARHGHGRARRPVPGRLRGPTAPLVPGNRLSATIDWGDGSTPTAGHILPGGWALQMPGSARGAARCRFTVVGEHVYATAGTFTVHVTVTSDAGATADDRRRGYGRIVLGEGAPRSRPRSARR